MYNLDLEKVEDPEIKLPTFVGSWRNQFLLSKLIKYSATAVGLISIGKKGINKCLLSFLLREDSEP